MKELRFNIFGKLIVVTGVCATWRACYLGPDGKRRPADVVMPAALVE
ncbi:DUF7661 family protein [Herbaspirillum sp. UBA812]